MIGHIMRVQIQMNSRYFQILLALVFSILLFGLFLTPVFTQTLSKSEVLEILGKMKQSRSEIVYNGLLEIEYRREKPRRMLFTVWAQPPSIYYLEPKLSRAKTRSKGTHSKFSEKKRMRRHAFQRNNREFDLFPNRKYLNLFARNFLVDKYPGVSIAGKKTVRLDVKPIHLPRFGIRLWFDESNYFILKREIVYFSDQNEFATMRHEFKKIEYGVTVPDSIVAKVGDKNKDHRRTGKRPGNRFKTVFEFMNKTEATPFLPEYLPDGFELVSIDYKQETSRDIIHLHYTDGLLNLSIFEIKGPLPKSFERLLKQPKNRKGQNYSFQQIIIRKVNHHSFLLIGNFSRIEIQQIADSLEKLDP